MKRIAVVAVVVGLMMAMAAPAPAKVKSRNAEGTTTFTLNPQCTPGVDCEIDFDTFVMTIPLLNPATKSGTFKGTQVLDADFMLNVVDNTFVMEGTIVFNGRVKACGVGTVVFDAYGAGYLMEDGSAYFEVNRETVNPAGTTLPITGVLNSPGALPTDPETGIGSGPYTGEYECNHSGK
jgi:hypothetical protein